MDELRIVDATELARAYAAAEYGAALDGRTFELRVGAVASGLEAPWPAPCYAFITAWNPASSPRPAAPNEEADARLRARLDPLSVPRVPAWARAPDGRWREPGWLLAGVAPAQLDLLARAFGQAGTLYWACGEPVRLRMLMAAPPNLPEWPCVDWVE